MCFRPSTGPLASGRADFESWLWRQVWVAQCKNFSTLIAVKIFHLDRIPGDKVCCLRFMNTVWIARRAVFISTVKVFAVQHLAKVTNVVIVSTDLSHTLWTLKVSLI